LHRFIAELSGMSLVAEIDHKNLNTLDNRTANLRPASKSEQRCNQMIQRNNTTGVKGITFHAGKFEAYVSLHRKRTWLGRFDTIAEAETVLVAARLSLHGEFANNGRPS